MRNFLRDGSEKPLKLRDTLFIAGGETVTEEKLFEENGIREQYRYKNLVDRSQQKSLVIGGVRINHNLQFAPAGSESASELLSYFENFSRLVIRVDGKDWDEIPLCDALPWITKTQPGSAVGAEELVQEFKGSNFYLQFQTPLNVPKGGDVELIFSPASGLTAIADAATNPSLPKSPLTNTRGFFVDFLFVGKEGDLA